MMAVAGTELLPLAASASIRLLGRPGLTDNDVTAR